MRRYSSLLAILWLAVLIAATTDLKAHRHAKSTSNSPSLIHSPALLIVPVVAVEPIETVLTPGTDIGATSSMPSTKLGSSATRTLDDLVGVREVNVVIIRTIDVTVSPEPKTSGASIIKTTATDSVVGRGYYECGAVNGCASVELLFQGRNGTRAVRRGDKKEGNLVQ